MDTAYHFEQPLSANRSTDWLGILRSYREEHTSVAEVFSKIEKALIAGIKPPTDSSIEPSIECYVDELVVQGYLEKSERNAAKDVLSNLYANFDPVAFSDHSTPQLEVASTQEVFRKKMENQVKHVYSSNPELADRMKKVLIAHPPTVDNLSHIGRWLTELLKNKIIIEKEYTLLLDGFTAE